MARFSYKLLLHTISPLRLATLRIIQRSVIRATNSVVKQKVKVNLNFILL
jgi:hypothetical protein